MSARQRLAAEQAALVRFLLDPVFEAAVRSDPPAACREAGVDLATGRALAAIDPARVSAFRASRAHKARLRRSSAAR